MDKFIKIIEEDNKHDFFDELQKVIDNGGSIISITHDSDIHKKAYVIVNV